MSAARNAIVSVHNKSGSVDFVTRLHTHGLRIYATSGTARHLNGNRPPPDHLVRRLETITSLPELLGGRVKTLDSKLYAGILARDTASDRNDLLAHNLLEFDVIVCNLYPFAETLAATGELAAAIESIDIGGVTLLRAAAKNSDRVLVVCDPTDYDRTLDRIAASGSLIADRQFRNEMAAKAFRLVEDYDRAIAEAFANSYSPSSYSVRLKYGMNPHQGKSSVAMPNAKNLPFAILNGNASYINILDALNAWQLVKSLRKTLNRPAAACFKHVSPAGVAIGNEFDVSASSSELDAFFIDRKRARTLSELARAFLRARNGDSLSAYGDFIALSHACDVSTASLIQSEVSDGVIAPAFEPAALEILRAKKGGNYVIIEIDFEYEPDRTEVRTVYGINLVQERNDFVPSQTDLENGHVCGPALDHSDFVDIVIGTIALKYTQSNSVCFVKNGQVIGIAAGQQSRLHATKLAAAKAKNWWMRQHELVGRLPFPAHFKRFEKNNAVDYFLSDAIPANEWSSFFAKQPPSPLTTQMRNEHLQKLTGVSYVSDACLPFCDNVEVANECRLKNVAAPLGSKNDAAIIEKCKQMNLTLVDLKHRLFHH